MAIGEMRHFNKWHEQTAMILSFFRLYFIEFLLQNYLFFK